MTPSDERLPPLLRGARRGTMALLVAAALVHAGCAVGTGLLVGRLLAEPGAPVGRVAGHLGALVLCGAGLAATRYAERVLAERLGQDYVQQLRRGIVAHAMTAGTPPSLGVTLARATNDLAGIRNWVSLGVAPTVALVPLLLGALGMLVAIDWRLGVTVAVPLVLLAAVMPLLAGQAYRRARVLRRCRGRLAARVADTVMAADAIALAGGTERELRAVDRAGGRVATAAVDRARTAGRLRAAALTAPLAASGATAGLGALAVIDAAAVASALTVLGIVGGPVAEVGRVVEYRQNHRAARRIVAPLLAGVAGPATGDDPAVRVRRALDDAESSGGRLLVRGLETPGGPVPDLTAGPGDRILVTAATRTRCREVLRALALPPEPGVVRVDGKDLGRVGPRTRRTRVGHAAQGGRVERGTVARAVRYRRPDLDEQAALAALAAVGLADLGTRLPDGTATVLRRGGAPLDRPELARLLLARAALGTPALLVIDHLDADLGADGTCVLRELVAAYPGVVVLGSDHPEWVGPTWSRWPVDAPSSAASAMPVSSARSGSPSRT